MLPVRLRSRGQVLQRRVLVPDVELDRLPGAHLGIVDGEPDAGTPTRFVNGIDGSGYLSAPYSAIFEPCRQLGDRVAAGDVAGRLYATEEVEREPLELAFDRAGVVMARRNGARVIRGDHLFMVASEMERGDVLARN